MAACVLSPRLGVVAAAPRFAPRAMRIADGSALLREAAAAPSGGHRLRPHECRTVVGRDRRLGGSASAEGLPNPEGVRLACRGPRPEARGVRLACLWPRATGRDSALLRSAS